MSSLYPLKKLGTVLVYDTNNLESLLAAAALASVTDLTTCDCRGLVPLAEKYIWLGVVPTVYYFNNYAPSEYKDSTHTAIVNILTTKGLKEISLKNVKYNSSNIHDGSDMKEAGFAIVNGYGNRGLLERALIFLGRDPETFSHLVYMPKNFYHPLASIELLQAVALNAKEAMKCLSGSGEPYIPIPYSVATGEAAEEAYSEFDEVAKTAIKNRCSFDWIQTSSETKPKNVLTFYEQTSWWFIRRRLTREDVIVRNISLTVSGAIVSSSLPYVQGIRVTDPVFVF